MMKRLSKTEKIVLSILTFGIAYPFILLFEKEEKEKDEKLDQYLDNLNKKTNESINKMKFSSAKF